MEKTTIVRYQSLGADKPLEIPVVYSVSTSGILVTIRCRVNLPLTQMPPWLKPYRFAVFATYKDNTCYMATNDSRGVYSLDAARFIGKVQEEILLVEKREGTEIAISAR